jgi:hypothetical protein
VEGLSCEGPADCIGAGTDRIEEDPEEFPLSHTVRVQPNVKGVDPLERQ